MKGIVQGVGINDANYPLYEWVMVNHKKKKNWCPYYSKWTHMLERCYNEKRHIKFPTYIGCSVDIRFLKLSDFIKWVDSQPERNWQNMELDKDILSDSKIYSPDNCVFISRKINAFTNDHNNGRGECMIGVSFKKGKKSKQYVTRCNDPLQRVENKSGHIGYFETELEAHNAWKSKKHEYALELAELESDERVKEALRTRYL